MSDLINGSSNGKHRRNGSAGGRRVGGGFGYLRTVLTILTFAVGIIASLLFQNLVGAEVVTFSTVGLVGFIISISVSVAAIVVSIAAVALGHHARTELKHETEESMRMQSEILNRTIDVLLKIEKAVTIPTR